MCFPASCCSVGKNGCVVSVKYAIEEASSGGFVYLTLGRILVEDAVKAECLVLDTLSVGDDAPREFLNGVVFRWVEDTGKMSVPWIYQ